MLSTRRKVYNKISSSLRWYYSNIRSFINFLVSRRAFRATCSDVDSEGKSVVAKVFARKAGVAINKEKFIAKLKEAAAQNPYMGKATSLSTEISTEPLKIVKRVDYAFFRRLIQSSCPSLNPSTRNILNLIQ